MLIWSWTLCLYYFYHRIKHLITLSVPQIDAISFWCTALSTFYSLLVGTWVEIIYLESWALCIGHKAGPFIPLALGTLSPLPGFPSPGWDLPGLLKMSTAVWDFPATEQWQVIDAFYTDFWVRSRRRSGQARALAKQGEGERAPCQQVTSKSQTRRTTAPMELIMLL